MTSRGLFGTVLACAVMAALPSSAQAAPSLEVGQPFPEITLPSLDGEPMSIASFRGQKVALHVWASW